MKHIQQIKKIFGRLRWGHGVQAGLFFFGGVAVSQGGYGVLAGVLLVVAGGVATAIHDYHISKR